jgi:hypothetical protein
VTDPFDVIHEGCFLALRFGLHVTATPTGNLQVVEGVYCFAGGPGCHPLEAALVGVNVSSGNWLTEVVSLLGVESAWIAGFLDGFAQEQEATTENEYVQGYLAAETLRTVRYRRQLPDR